MNSNRSDSTSIGKRIKEQREKNNLTQFQLSKKLFVKREVVNYWENGRRDVKIENIALLADELNTTCDYLIRGVPTENIDIVEATGLNNNSIERLKFISSMPSRDNFIDLPKALNSFLSSEHLVNFLMMFWNYQNEVEILQNEKILFSKWLERYGIKPEQDIMKQAAILALETFEIDLHNAAKSLMEQNEKVSFSRYRLQNSLNRIADEYQ